MIHNARGDIPCPLCGKPRSARAMEQHLRQSHTAAGREEQFRAGRVAGGRQRPAWWRRQLVRKGL